MSTYKQRIQLNGLFPNNKYLLGILLVQTVYTTVKLTTKSCSRIFLPSNGYRFLSVFFTYFKKKNIFFIIHYL